MVFERVQSKKDRPIEGVVSVGVIVFAHFENPARRQALDLRVLLWKERCLVSTPPVIEIFRMYVETFLNVRFRWCLFSFL